MAKKQGLLEEVLDEHYGSHLDTPSDDPHYSRLSVNRDKKASGEHAIKSILHNLKKGLISQATADRQLKAQGHPGVGDAMVDETENWDDHFDNDTEANTGVPVKSGPTINGKQVDDSSVEVDGVDMKDYPDFCDAYISHALFTDGTPLTDEELNELSDDGEYVYSKVEAQLYEGKNVKLDVESLKVLSGQKKPQ